MKENWKSSMVIHFCDADDSCYALLKLVLWFSFTMPCGVSHFLCGPEFEGDEYYKTDVRPALEDGSQVNASVYVWQDSARYAPEQRFTGSMV